MQECAFLLKGLTVEVYDEEDDKKEVFCYENGVKSFVEYLNDGKKPLHNVVHFDATKDNIRVEIAFQYTDTYSENIISFVNNVKTNDGGTHEVGFKTALTRVYNEYAKANGIIKGKDKNLEGKCKTRSLKFHASIKLKDHIMLHSNPVCIN